jgi:hypothetical protein
MAATFFNPVMVTEPGEDDFIVLETTGQISRRLAFQPTKKQPVVCLRRRVLIVTTVSFRALTYAHTTVR